AAMAGALGVSLEKVGCYRLGDGAGPIGAETIGRAVSMLYVASALGAAGAAAATWWMRAHA
ncbi:MAG TPA: cobalamin biosynthesis protein, partial [Polyangia bacterium]